MFDRPGPMQNLRDSTEYGDVYLSIQASRTHYCTPREDGLPLEMYDTVEVALIHNDDLCKPSEVGLDGFDHLFETGLAPVAAQVSWPDVKLLIEALQERMNS